MLYGTITEFCTEESCPVMSAGPKYEVGNWTLQIVDKHSIWNLWIIEHLSAGLNLSLSSVSLGRWKPSEEANQMFGPKVHRLPYDMGPGMMQPTIYLWFLACVVFRISWMMRPYFHPKSEFLFLRTSRFVIIFLHKYSFQFCSKLLKMLQTIAKTILKRLFRVYAHIYHQHFKVGKTFY